MEQLTVKPRDLVVDDTLLRVGIFDCRIIVRNEIRLQEIESLMFRTALS